MLFRFYEEKPVEEIEENYYKKYLKLMKNYERVFSFQMDGVPLGESDGAFDLTIDFFGNASWDGFGEGCGRAGEDYAKKTKYLEKDNYTLPKVMNPESRVKKQ